MIRNVITLGAVAALLPVFTACGESGTSTVRVTASDTSAMRQALAAIEAESFETICLNVVNVRVRIASDDEALSGWHDLALAEPETDETETEPECPLDLAALLRGEVVELAWGEVPSGSMTELRFVLAEDQGYAIMAGDTTGTHIPVLVPSGSQSGLKFKGDPIALEPDEEEEVHLIFDAEASIREHNGGAVRIRPVVRMSATDATPDNGAGGSGGAGGAGGSGGTGGTGGAPILQ